MIMDFVIFLKKTLTQALKSYRINLPFVPYALQFLIKLINII